MFFLSKRQDKVKKRSLSIEYPLNKKIPAWAAAANRRTRNICQEVREGARFRRGSIYHEVNHELHLPTENKNAREDSSHSFGMTMRVISNEVRDPSLIPFSKKHTKDTKFGKEGGLISSLTS
jgi:hypothetical protein